MTLGYNPKAIKQLENNIKQKITNSTQTEEEEDRVKQETNKCTVLFLHIMTALPIN